MMDQPQQLIDQLLDGSIDPACIDPLGRWIKSHPEHARIFARQTLAHASMREFFEPAAVLSELQAQPPAPTRGPRRVSWLAAAGVVLAVGLAVALLSPPGETKSHREPAPVALLTNTDNAVFADSSAPMHLGGDLPPGPIKLTSGAAQIMFASTAVVDLTGPCEFEMTGENRGKLTSGKLEAYVRPEAVGFTVSAPGLIVTDLGTRFTVTVSSAGQSQTQVIEGQVHVQLLDAQNHVRQEMTLSAQQGLAYDMAHGRVTRLFLDVAGEYTPRPSSGPGDMSHATQITRIYQQGRNGYRGAVDVMIERSLQNAASFIVTDAGADPVRRVIDGWGAPFAPDYPTTMMMKGKSKPIGDNWRIGLLKFDGLFEAVPEGSRIKSAKLSLHVVNPWETMAMWRILTPWEADSVSWDAFDHDGQGADHADHPRDGGGPTPGVNIVSEPEFRGAMPQGPATLDVTTTVESWFADPASNHGWCFTQWDDPNRGQFVACEDEVHPEQRPSLSITYELIPATSDGGTP